jgi:hypothetical protein
MSQPFPFVLFLLNYCLLVAIGLAGEILFPTGTTRFTFGGRETLLREP